MPISKKHWCILFLTYLMFSLFWVTEALNSIAILQKYIKFPMTWEERNAAKKKFMDMFQFPGVLGCIDGTHVSVIRPHENEEAHFNRKLYQSLNVIETPDRYAQRLYLMTPILWAALRSPEEYNTKITMCSSAALGFEESLAVLTSAQGITLFSY